MAINGASGPEPTPSEPLRPEATPPQPSKEGDARPGGLFEAAHPKDPQPQEPAPLESHQAKDLSHADLPGSSDPLSRSRHLGESLAGKERASAGARLVAAAQQGIDAGFAPQRCDGVLGGYLLFDKSGMPCALFKPQNEEVGAMHSAFDGRLRTGISPGEGARREWIASALDHGAFAGVPVAAVAMLSSPSFPQGRQEGVLVALPPQAQVGAFDIDAELVGASSVQRTAILDIRLWNTDRHMGSFLVEKGSGDGAVVLRPFGHAACLSASLEDMHELQFAWTFFGAAAQPFGADEQRYIADLNPIADAALMRSGGLGQLAVDQMLLGTLLLKEGVKVGLTPSQLGELLPTPGLHSLLATAGAAADKVRREAQQPGYPLGLLTGERLDSYRDETFLQKAEVEVRALVAVKAREGIGGAP